MKKYTLCWVSLLLGSFCLSGYAATELARVNNKVITLEDLNTHYSQSLQYYQPSTPTKTSVLDDMIKKELGVQEAKKMGLEKDPEVIDAVNTVLFNALISKKLGKEFQTISVTDDEAKGFYAKYPEVRTSHIFVSAPGYASRDVMEKAKAKIESIYKEHVAPGKEDFAEVAQRFSEGATAAQGGDVGFRMKGSIDPAYYSAAVALANSGKKVSGIVRGQDGFYIIKLTAAHGWDEVDHASVKRLLIVERQHEAFDKYMAQLRAQSRVSVHGELLKD